MQNPILITGVARSGTSLTAGIIHYCGAWGGVLSPPNDNNKKGMFENIAIRQTITKPYLKELGVDKLGQHPLPDLKNQALVNKLYSDGAAWRISIQNVILTEGYRTGPWFYKGAKMCLMWPLWNGAFPHADWIIVRRDAEKIARSCMKTSFMRAFNTIEEWAKWAQYHEWCFSEMKKAGLKTTEIWPDEIIKGNLAPIKKVVEDLGLTWNESKVMSFITPELWEA